MKFIAIEETKEDMFTKEFESKEEAITYADMMWSKTSDNDKKNVFSFYVIESKNPDVESDDHFDGDVVKSYK